MIGLSFFGFMGFILGQKLARRLHLRPAWSLILAPLLFVAPMIDEIIGRWQFNQMCEKESVIWLNPNWRKVKAVRDASPHSFTQADWGLIPIEIQKLEYIDVATGQPVLSYRALHTDGGIALGKFGLGLGGTSSCWPKNELEIRKMIDIETLLNQGKSK
jgi:hypothetical protein